MKRRYIFTSICIAALSISTFQSFAQEEEPDAAKAAQNPLANVISMPFQNNTDFGIGTDGQTGNTVNIQPILPLTLGKNKWLLINRFIIPLPKSVPDPISESNSNITGIGDVNYTAWFAPPLKGAWTLGFGAVTIWPTASSEYLGQGKFSLGPSMVLVYANPGWLGAAVISNWVSVGGDDARPDVNTFYFQYIYTRFLPKKWYVSTAPINLANWNADEGQKWTVPLGGGFGKMFNAGNLPMDMQVQAFYNVVRPDHAAVWQLRVQLKLIFATGKK